jgi:cardiolipin synthase
MILINKPIIRFHTKTHVAWEAMLEACKASTKSILIEQYIFSNDDIGRQFIEVLIERANSGVKVKILLDMVGSLGFFLSGLDHHLKEKKIEVLFFNPISLWRAGNITSHFFRDHRKLVVIDDSIGFIGGVGIEDRMRSWRDNMIEVRGDLCKNMTHIFDLTWRRVLRGKYKRFTRPPVYHKHYEIAINSPRFGQRFIYYDHIAHIRRAQRKIYLATPYFAPDGRFFRVLRIAAHRGVDVRLVIPEVSDVYSINYIQGWYITRALESGIRVFLYKESFYHTKMSLVDEDWATTGSFNLDSLSFSFNHEANVSSTDDDFVGRVEDLFDNDFALSKEVKIREWNKRSTVQKVMEKVMRPFHKLF